MIYNGLLTEEQVVGLRKSAPYDISNHPMMGGNFFQNVLNKAKKLGRFAVENKDQILKLGKAGYDAYKSNNGSALKKHHKKRHHRMRGGRLDSESDYTSSSSYTDGDSYVSGSETESSDEDSYRGGKMISKQNLRNRLN